MQRLLAARVRKAMPAMLLVLLAIATMPTSRAQMVIYRCTDASGAVTLQNGTPCPKGTRQQKKVMETPPPAPIAAPVAAPPVLPVAAPAPPVVAPAPEPEPPPIAAPKSPPPALFECRTWNRERYFSDDARPPPRCVPVQVTGLDGTGAMAGGTACQMTEDPCQPVPEAALCDAWTQRVREFESATLFAAASRPTPAEGERIRRVLADSTCTP